MFCSLKLALRAVQVTPEIGTMSVDGDKKQMTWRLPTGLVRSMQQRQQLLSQLYPPGGASGSKIVGYAADGRSSRAAG